MQKLENWICKNRIKILITTLILMIPAIIGMMTTKINYDILVYLPEDIETIEGQNILKDEFDMGAFSVTILEGMDPKEIISLEEEIKQIKGVAKVMTTYDLIGTTIPLEILPSEIKDKVEKDGSDLMLITFTESTSDETTLEAIKQIREITKEKCKVGGMSAMVLDTMNLSEREIFIYIVIAVILCIIVLELSLDSYIVPFLLLINIGISILFNLGTILIFGEISYITKALVAVLQLGVTTDFSIFLYHAYENAKKDKKNNIEAMETAIHETFTSVIGSSLTTIAGFLVLCTMKLTLGMDLGLVMAKGVLLGVICVLTVFPSLILVSEKLIEKTKHKSIMPNFNKLTSFIIKHHKKAFAIFIILIIPAYLANSKIDIYYKLDESLPKDLDCIIANNELKEKFNIVSPEIILTNKDMKNDKLEKMLKEVEDLEGIDLVLSFNKLSELGISEELLSEDVIKIFKSDNYQMTLINSTYEIASDELNEQVEELNKIIDKYDEDAILAGEGPLMKDLINISDKDFKNVNASSIICITLIMLIVLKSISLPLALILVIEFAIFINLAIPYFSGTSLPFVAPIVLGTIQLGATIDYAILMTTTYIKNRKAGTPKEESMKKTLSVCIGSILVSGLCFFGATFGVGVYSELEMISSLCTLISRGAIISMIVVIFILPSVLLIFDKLIIKTTSGFKKEENKMNKTLKKVTMTALLFGMMTYTFPVYALTKEETVYAKLNNAGLPENIFVNTHLINNDKLDELTDETDLLNIMNINGSETFTKENTTLTWNAKGNDIYYKGTTEKELPVTVEIKYYLDGEETTLKDMLGKSGNIKLSLKYTNHDKHVTKVNGTSETLYTPFVALTGMIIKGEGNTNIKVYNGKVINNGKDNIVVGLSSPGLYESLKINELKNMNEVTIEFTTTKFELPNIYTVVTPKIIDEEDLKIFNELDNIYGSINTLKTSIDEIEKGAGELVNGSAQIFEGSSLISTNLETVVTKLEELESGTIKIDEGLKLILANLNNTKNLFGALNMNDINNLIEANTNMINNTTDTNVQAILTQNNAVLTGIKNLSTNINETIKLLETALQELEQGSKQISEGTKELTEGIKILSSKTKELSVGTENLYNGTKTLYAGINKYNQEGITTIYNLMNTKIRGTENRIKALVKLGEEYDTFTMNNKDNDSSTKFILNIPGEKYKETEYVVKQTKKEETLWTRIKNLFK